MILERGMFLQVADRIGSRLCREAVWSDNMCNWLGWESMSINNSPVPTYGSSGTSLYRGTSGIALFLAHLWHYTGNKRHRIAMEGAINQVLTYYDDIPSHSLPGFYSGLGGVAWTFVRIGELIAEERLVDKGLELLDKVTTCELGRNHLDVICGSAGMIPIYLKLGARYGREAFFEAALAGGEHLLAHASEEAEGWSWKMDYNPAPLSGYSHGAAGIAVALLDLYATTGLQRFLTGAEMALVFERSLFSEKQRNWRRQPADAKEKYPGSGGFQMSWCYGAPGIGLARLRCLELLGDDLELERELDVALSSTSDVLVSPPAHVSNYSLCHGLAGNSELLLEAALKLERNDLWAQVEQVGLTGVESYDKQGGHWPCGVGGIGEHPGLMVGLAGIGYFYLRLFRPKEVPSILLLRGVDETVMQNNKDSFNVEDVIVAS